MQIRPGARFIRSDRYRLSQRMASPGRRPKSMPHRSRAIGEIITQTGGPKVPAPALFSPIQETYWGVFAFWACDSGTAVNHIKIGDAMKIEL